jgi:hypothetical protein
MDFFEREMVLGESAEQHASALGAEVAGKIVVLLHKIRISDGAGPQFRFDVASSLLALHIDRHPKSNLINNYAARRFAEKTPAWEPGSGRIGAGVVSVRSGSDS